MTVDCKTLTTGIVDLAPRRSERVDFSVAEVSRNGGPAAPVWPHSVSAPTATYFQQNGSNVASARPTYFEIAYLRRIRLAASQKVGKR
jgi:hypothetical protein